MNIGVVTVSGVHGVGKSAVCEFLKQTFATPPLPERPSNPFVDPYHSMMFFIVAYSKRDQAARQLRSPLVIDRYSFHDIAVYVEVLHELNKVTDAQYETLRLVNTEVLCGSLDPEVAVLLEDDADSVVGRLIQRGGKPGHIFEYDREVIYHLNEAFTREFNNWEITRTWVGSRILSRPHLVKISVRGRSVSDVGCDLLSRLEELNVSSASVNKNVHESEGSLLAVPHENSGGGESL